MVFLLGRSKSKQQPTLLKLRETEAQKTNPTPIPESQAEPALTNEPPVVAQIAPETPASPEREVGPRSSNNKLGRAIYFVYNGHEWEAHEVMGLNRESDMHHVTQTYQRILKTADVSTLEFYESAYRALLKSKNKT